MNKVPEIAYNTMNDAGKARIVLRKGATIIKPPTAVVTKKPRKVLLRNLICQTHATTPKLEEEEMLSDVPFIRVASPASLLTCNNRRFFECSEDYRPESLEFFRSAKWSSHKAKRVVPINQYSITRIRGSHSPTAIKGLLGKPKTASAPKLTLGSETCSNKYILPQDKLCVRATTSNLLSPHDQSKAFLRRLLSPQEYKYTYQKKRRWYDQKPWSMVNQYYKHNFTEDLKKMKKNQQDALMKGYITNIADLLVRRGRKKSARKIAGYMVESAKIRIKAACN